jgi:hypothetical protein
MIVLRLIHLHFGLILIFAHSYYIAISVSDQLAGVERVRGSHMQ